MLGTDKRTFELTEAEIDALEKEEVMHWMDRIMMRLYQVLDKLAYDVVGKRLQRAAKSYAAMRTFLKEAVGLIRLKIAPQPA